MWIEWLHYFLLYIKHEKCISSLQRAISYQTVENISLMDVDSNKSLVFGSLHRLEVPSGGVDEQVEQIQESVVHVCHHSAICSGLHQCYLCIPRPDHLKAQQSNLGNVEGDDSIK